MQLVAYGAQDIYLTGNPQITFFKVVYRRHTNFSMESIQQTFNGTADFGNKVTCTVARNGDLIGRCYLTATLPVLENISSNDYDETSVKVTLNINYSFNFGIVLFFVLIVQLVTGILLVFFYNK